MAGRFSVEAVFSAIDKVTAPVTRMQNAVGKMTRSVERGLRSVTAVTNSAVKGITSATGTIVKFGVAGLGLLAGAVALVTREFSKVENAEAAFTPLMGGAERARKLVEALNAEAASTPFQFEHLADAAGQLLPVMNGDIERVIKTMRMLGDTAGGNAQKLDSITRGFTKAMLKGKVDMESLNMIAEAGVPIFDDLAAVMGVKVNAAFFKMISAGKVTTKQLEAAFAKMTGSGGKFFQGMEIASRTTDGMWSSLMDNVSLTAAAIGEVLSPTVKEVIGALDGAAQRARAWVTANRELIQSRVVEFVERIKRGVSDFIDYLVELNRKQSILDRISEGFRKAGDAVDWLVAHGGEILTLTKWVAGLVIGLNILVGALTLVNLVMAANPIGLIVVGIVAAIAAITAMVVYVDELIAMFENAPVWLRVMLAPLELVLRTIKLIKDNWDSIVSGGKKFAAFLGFDVAEAPSAAAAGAASSPASVDTSRFTENVFGPVVNVAPPTPPAVSVAAPPAVVAAGQAPVVNVAPPTPPAVSVAAPPAVVAAGQAPVVNVAPPAVSVAAPPPTPPAVSVAAPPAVVAASQAPVVNVAPPLLRAPQAAQAPTFGQPSANEEQQPAAAPVMVTPQDRVSRSIEERTTNTNSNAEVTIRDGTGRAEVTKGKLNSNIKLQKTGSF